MTYSDNTPPHTHTYIENICFERHWCICLRTCLTIYLSVCKNLFILMFVHLYVCIPVYLKVWLSVCLAIYLYVCSSVRMSVSIYLSVPHVGVFIPENAYLSARLSIYLPICSPDLLSLCLSFKPTDQISCKQFPLPVPHVCLGRAVESWLVELAEPG